MEERKKTEKREKWINEGERNECEKEQIIKTNWAKVEKEVHYREIKEIQKVKKLNKKEENKENEQNRFTI